MTATGIDTMPFTIAHFAVLAVFAALTIAGILWGIKLKRRRRQAAEDFEAHRDAADAPTEAAPAETAPEGAGVADGPAAPVAPAPTPDPVTSSDTVPPPPVEPTAAESSRGGAAPLAGDITKLKGLGSKLAATLAQLGITRVDQIAAMSTAELDALDAQLGAFKGRPARDRWAEQARLLMAGDKAAYEAEFGKLGG